MRIRFKELKDGYFESTQKFSHPTNGAVYKVLINKVKGEYSIINVDLDFPEATGIRIKYIALLRGVRSALRKLGVELKKDKRKLRVSPTKSPDAVLRT